MANSLGALVKALRTSRIYFDEESGTDKQWTQAILAEKTEKCSRQLTENNVGDIEQGTVRIDPDTHLEPLACAFELGEHEKRELYAAAGFIYHSQQRRNYEAGLNHILDRSPFPAFAVTPLWDCVAENRYIRLLYNVTDEHIQEFTSGPLGPNYLKAFFDPAFGRKELLNTWYTTTVRYVWMFKIMSFRYRATNRYGRIMHELKKYDDFQRIYDEATPDSGKFHTIFRDTTYSFPMGVVKHPDFGELYFYELKYPIEFVGERFTIFMYAPMWLPEIKDPGDWRRLIDSELKESFEGKTYKRYPLE